jgi:hypothetical protein
MLCKHCALTQQSKAASPNQREDTDDTDLTVRQPFVGAFPIIIISLNLPDYSKG